MSFNWKCWLFISFSLRGGGKGGGEPARGVGNPIPIQSSTAPAFAGGWTIFFARFITGLRVVGALAAGTAGMPWPRFLAANVCGALAWATVIALLGYFFGEHWQLLEKWLGRGSLIALTVVLLIGVPLLWSRLQKSKNLTV